MPAASVPSPAASCSRRISATRAAGRGRDDRAGTLHRSCSGDMSRPTASSARASAATSASTPSPAGWLARARAIWDERAAAWDARSEANVGTPDRLADLDRTARALHPPCSPRFGLVGSRAGRAGPGRVVLTQDFRHPRRRP